MWYYISFYDYLLFPVYALIFFLIIKIIANRKYIDDPFLKKKFVQGFWIKVFAALAYAMFIQYYYGGGDSFRYFAYSNVMHDAIVKDFSNIRLLFSPAENFYDYCESLSEIKEFNPANAILRSEGNMMIIRFTTVLGFICFKRFLLVSLLISILAYLGIWKMFLLFYNLYKPYKKEVAFSFLFLPSFWFWGSGVLKETICIMALGFLLSHCYTLFFQTRFRIASIIKIFLFAALIFLTKLYILAAFAAGFFAWFLARLLKKIKSRIATVFAVMAIIGIFFISLSFISFDLESQKEEILDQVGFFSDTYKAQSEESGTPAYTGMEITPSVSGIIKNIPLAITTIFFRPYIWEARSMVLFISMLESCFFLILFLKVLIAGRIFGAFGRIFQDPALLFCLIFSLVLGLIIGFTSFNFGAIIRYKIPCMPFFCMMLLILNSQYRKRRLLKTMPESIT